MSSPSLFGRSRPNDEDTARLSREHNDANVLALGERLTPFDAARRMVNLFLDTPFAGGRHQQRIDKLTTLDAGRGSSLKS